MELGNMCFGPSMFSILDNKEQLKDNPHIIEYQFFNTYRDLSIYTVSGGINTTISSSWSNR